ncbi:MAG TPA: FAD-dependent oxidoreductase [Thermoanaerobaculia bacterium]|nr:FAD-dependent oxidoreductase [Thermoanaerobaculia bacterium]
MTSTRSLWIATTSHPRFAPFRPDAHAAVAIVGGGITGLTAAVLLAARGRSVCVLEGGRIAEGESGLTTAHITAAVDARYHHLARTHSKDVAKAVAEASRAAIDQLAETVARDSISCGFRRLPGYLYTERRSRIAELKKEAAAANEAGLAAAFVETVPLPFPVRAAVRFDDQAEFHPREYLLALAQRVAASIFEQVRVLGIDEGTPCRIRTTAGEITADSVFVATNAPINDVTLHTRTAPYRSYAIALPYDEPLEGLFWDTADPYHYIRTQETSEGTFLIAGGEDHKVGREEGSGEAFAKLEQFTRERFPDAGPVAYRWSGQIIEPHDGLPFIGRVSNNIYVSTGYAGQGMTFGTLGAMIVADLIEGVENRFARVFDAGRVHLRGALSSFVRENLDFPKELATHTLAGSRDAPICTHMGCRTRWNDAEESWDCPCHGSRFARDGSVLNGPATQPVAVKAPVGKRKEEEIWRRERDSNPR